MAQAILPLQTDFLKKDLLITNNKRFDMSRKLRIAIYSHDTMGMGHMRRNLMISKAISKSSLPANILLITGARQASAAQMPDGVDCITLPSLRKESDGSYRSRSLDMPVEEIQKIRSQMISSSIASFEPDIFIVDNVPRGALRELDKTLHELRWRSHTYCILGLRDVLDDPEKISAEWLKAENEEAIHHFYDKIWIYGDSNVYDAVTEYKMPYDIAKKVSYTGYFDRRICFKNRKKPRLNLGQIELGTPSTPFVLCLVGGGQDGAALTEAFALASFPEGMFGVIITGLLMPEEAKRKLHKMAAIQANLIVIEFVKEPMHLLQQADSVIAMGGYNVVSEILSYEKRSLIVPRVTPRKEQLIRAERLNSLGLIDVAHPEEVTPKTLSTWIAQATQDSSSPSVHNQLDFDGLSKLPCLIKEICQSKALISNNA